MNLTKIRTEKGMTQTALAKQLGVTSQAVSNYELGLREPSFVKLRKMADILECTVDELIGDDDEIERTTV